MKLRLLFTLLVSLILSSCSSQRATTPPPAEGENPESTATDYAGMSWKKLAKAAEAEKKDGNKGEAAKLYRLAWDKKQRKTELLFEAAELFTEVNDYRGAADAYQFLQSETDEYPLVGLKFARALKQDGQYDRAQRALARFLEGYNEADRPIIEEIVNVELAGIELAQRQAGRSSDLKLKRPTEGINSESDEFGPIPGDVGQLYFSSNRGEQSRIYESRLQGRTWTNAAPPQGFPVIASGEYGTGSISPDGERFYFTICSGTTGEDGAVRCEIFRSNRTPNGWGQPEALPDYINTKGVNNAFPHAAIVNGREVLYFCSNRDGGRGGLDIWYSARDIGLTDGDFSYPANLGPVINTIGDEMTPYYSNEELSLYFSSNGHPSLGGLDVLKAAGQDINWARPENLGLPINSVADDYGFVIDRLGGGDGYLVSNRAFGGIKNNTTETDIFQVNINSGQILLKASVYDNQAGTQLNNVSVTLYQIFSDGLEDQLVQRDFPSGSYLFELGHHQRLRVEVTRPGYQKASYTLTTNLEGVTTYGQPLFLLPEVATPTNTPNNQTGYPNNRVPTPTYPNAGSNPAPPATTPPPTLSPPATTTPPATTPTPAPSAPTYTGRYYKVQISAVRIFDPNEGKYQAIKSVGEIGAEDIPGRNLKRVTVGTYITPEAAKSALQQIQRSGFPSAFTVQYDDGVRYGRVNL